MDTEALTAMIQKGEAIARRLNMVDFEEVCRALDDGTVYSQEAWGLRNEWRDALKEIWLNGDDEELFGVFFDLRPEVPMTRQALEEWARACALERKQTGFDKYFEEQMRSPSFAESYEAAREEIDRVDWTRSQEEADRAELDLPDTRIVVGCGDWERIAETEGTRVTVEGPDLLLVEGLLNGGLTRKQAVALHKQLVDALWGMP